MSLLHDISWGTCCSASRQAWHLSLGRRKGFVLTSGPLMPAEFGSTQTAAGANTSFQRHLFKEPKFNGRGQCLKSVQPNWWESCAEFAAQEVQIASRKMSYTSRQRELTSWKKSPWTEIRCFHELILEIHWGRMRRRQRDISPSQDETSLAEELWGYARVDPAPPHLVLVPCSLHPWVRAWRSGDGTSWQAGHEMGLASSMCAWSQGSPTGVWAQKRIPQMLNLHTVFAHTCL